MQNQKSRFPIRVGRFVVRLAEDAADIAAAQALRYEVFYKEMGGTATAEAARREHDFDLYDAVCDHLLVIDTATGVVVGNYRLLRQEIADAHFGFYSATEFDLSPLTTFVPEGLLEVGRACVRATYRKTTLMMLLWSGIAAYVERYGIKYLFGCGSLPGIDPDQHANTLRMLYEDHLAPEHLRVRPLPGRHVSMLREVSTPPETTSPILPPLIEGYLALGGAYVGDGAVIDYDMRTVDVCLIVDTEKVFKKYRDHFLGSGD